MSKSALTLGAAAIALLASRKSSAATDEGGTTEPLEAMAARIAGERGCSPVVLLATIDTENDGWDTFALNNGPGDRERGGAWGLMQITATTAIAVDDKHPSSWRSFSASRDPLALIEHPEVCIELGASLIAENEARATARSTRGSLGWLQDVAALYNSGKHYAIAPADTRDKYVPRFMRNYRRRQGTA